MYVLLPVYEGTTLIIYRYRLLRSYFNQTTHWRTFDPFAFQKDETFRSSSKAIYREPAHFTPFSVSHLPDLITSELATTFHDIEAEKDALRSDPEKLAVLFKEMIQMCLW